MYDLAKCSATRATGSASMEAGKESLTVCEALGLSNEMVTLREPTLRGERGDRGGETESSDMLVGCVGAASPVSGRLFHGRSFLGRAQPRSSGRSGAEAFVEPLGAVRNLEWGRRCATRAAQVVDAAESGRR